ncbi:hypothetical protein BB934_05105 [Microvirga ossetica]|uniref:Uncharacterized protein n=1 Tax=Microvirga ossetica TaxID=1882682 RepID=A0A1B2ECM2_9HYPH|nr:hypothetical protein [Microvirga ossetica]ANY77687.1 hypothetical protein BB934_05105 [Microvirga ossetica]
MLEDQDPATARMADLSYAIASARAVVMALIARDRDAAEEAALRSCRDCDLLIRLIRDLAGMLQTNDLNQLTCSQAELRWLARRAAYVLTFVGAQAPNARSPLSLSAQGETGGMPVVRQQDRAPPPMPNRVPTHPASSGLTVASTGLRVRLIPVDGGEEAGSSQGDKESDQHGPEEEAHPPPVER